MTADDLTAVARAWIDGDPDADTRAALQELLDRGDHDALAEHVGSSLTFGTAGLRGEVGPGPNRMNRAVVIRTSRGLADHLLATIEDAAERGVVVGFDARHDSERFARDTVATLAGAGLAVRWFPTPQPTPIVAYAQKALGAAAAVVVTASHNPPADNGYKVYEEGAAQIVPPTDAAIAAAIEAVGPASDVPRVDPVTSELVAPVTAELFDRYLDELRTARPAADGPARRIAYTPMHGVGLELVRRALAEGGHDDLHVVASQAEPDGDFPTVPFPNPEEPGAMDLLLALAQEVGADLALANDPDADRIAVALPDRHGRWRALTGNQIGVLLADHLLAGSKVDRPLVVSSIVSTPMVADVAADHGARAEVTLTGFKWICAAARVLERDDGRQLVYGFEEALGSCVGTAVRDKDGIGAAVVVADLARVLAADGRTLFDRWDELCQRYGRWVSHQHSIVRPGASGAAEIAAAMDRLSGHTPQTLAGYEVTSTTDFRIGAEARPPWLATHDLVAFELAGGRAMIRPSGTEPKCKIYVDLRAEVDAERDPEELDAELKEQARAVALALAEEVGLS
ncbi:MAG: phospho-sugar mutase [Nitriliruptoraceae bacterium]